MNQSQNNHASLIQAGNSRVLNQMIKKNSINSGRREQRQLNNTTLRQQNDSSVSG